MGERYWLDETDPAQLRRRADDFEAEHHLGLASQLRERAEELERSQQANQGGMKMRVWAIEGHDGELEPDGSASVPWLFSDLADAEVKAAHLCEFDSDATGFKPVELRLDRAPSGEGK